MHIQIIIKNFIWTQETEFCHNNFPVFRGICHLSGTVIENLAPVHHLLRLTIKELRYLTLIIPLAPSLVLARCFFAHASHTSG